MSSKHRFVVVVLTMGFLTALACLESVAGQAPPAPRPVVAQGKAVLKRPAGAQAQLAPPGASQPAAEGEGPADSIHLPSNPDAKRLLGVARDYIGEEAWGQAASVLQALIDLPEDAFIQVKRRGDDGKDKTNWISIRVEANRLIGTMPDQGIQFYELRNGGKAKSLLSKAKAQNDPALLADVALKFLHTEAGAEATDLLGTYYLDRGQDVKAALCFETLLKRLGDKAGALTLFKACLAFQRIGDEKKREDAWKLLAARARDGIEVGDERVSLERLRDLLVKAPPPRRTTSVYDWTLFRGDAKRNAQGKGGTLFREPRWTLTTLPEWRDNEKGKPWVEGHLKTASHYQEGRNQPLIPGFFPIAAGGKLIYRSYEGIHAIDPKKDTDQLEWMASLDGALGVLASDSEKRVQMSQWWDQFYVQWGPQNVLFENSMVGSMSSDNVRVYVVDDVALPPHPMLIQQQGFGAAQPAMGQMQNLVNHSVLNAFDLESGKIVWERGRSEKDDLFGTYFLGPPLPLGGKLYVLNEKTQELRLLCLDASRGDTAWTQTLATARDRILHDIGRHINAAHLAYADGILVCPTNAGAVLGVDLLTHSLIWAYLYRDGSPVPDQNAMMQRRLRGGVAWGMQGMAPNLSAEGWKACAPIIHDGKVILTAPDGSSVRCVNLRDGIEAWRANRDNDFYVGGAFATKNGPIVFLVGKSNCRALDLRTGKQQWVVETGLPSGVGVASGNQYYLPLKTAAQDKKPEICVIDLDKAKDVAHTKSRNEKAVFGNLLFYDGDVISQGLSEITCYPQMDVKLALISKSLAKDPKNPVGLVERGELLLDKGDLPGALSDLRTAMANHPPENLQPRARTKLYETFVQLFHDNFPANEKYLKEFEEVCKVEARAGALAEEVQRAKEEEHRRRSSFLYLKAEGKERQGKLLEAFEAYQDFSAVAGGGKELIGVPGEQSVKARPDIWAQGRIAAMIAKATPAQRKPLEDKIVADWKTVQASGNLVAIRHFVDLFGSLFQVGREARLVLAERLMQASTKDNFLDAELQLQQLRQQKDDPVMTGRAVEALARLMIKKGLLEDAAYYYRELGRDYPNVSIRDGKTGADYYNELVTDKRFLPYLGGPIQPWKGVRLRDDTQNPYHGRFPMQPAFTLRAEGERTPFFQHRRFVLEQNGFALKIIDDATGEQVWQSPQLTQAYYLFQNGYNNVRFIYHARGHLVVLCVGTVVYAFDPVDQRKLWEQPLTGDLAIPAQGGMPGGARIMPDQNGNLQLVYNNGDILRLGQPGPVGASYACMQTRDGLLALDPLTGRILWTRSDVPTRSHVFGDDQYVYVADLDGAGTVTRTRTLRALDGVSLDLPAFTQPYKNKARILGRHLLWSESNASGLVVHLHDISAAKDLWKENFPPNSKILHSEEPTLAGVADPEGTVTVLDLSGGKELLKLKMTTEEAKNATAIHLLADGDQLYLIADQPIDRAKQGIAGGPWTNSNHMPSIQVNGTLHAYDRATGKLRWQSEGPVEHQMLLLERFRDLPVVIFTAQYQKTAGPAGGFNGNRWMATEVYDKATGKLCMAKELMSNGNQFFGLSADIQSKSIELVSFEMKLRLVPDTGSRKGEVGRAKDTSGPTFGQKVDERKIELRPPIPGGVRPVPGKSEIRRR